MSNTKPKGRELPPKFSVVTTTECFFKFRFWMRVKILFGYNLNVTHRMFSVNSPGRSYAQFQETLSKHPTAEAHTHHEPPEPAIPETPLTPPDHRN